MHHFIADRIVVYTPQQMFDLVADVEKYPEFVPLCKKIVVHSHEKQDRDVIIIASMKIGYIGMHETFVTQVKMQKDKNRIVVQHVKYLFNFLENHWNFEETPSGGCIVRFSIKYELKNRLFDKILNKMFNNAFLSFAKEFEKRAKIIYGSIQ
ncbi:MAG: ubiquinone-binding protein [Candidatus Liberibacter europaeus]|uniref:Ubiquinone-binding protein n=1 Tax=Candidatus Liberibacter europaeus TaxID=744859 RepID=A0A2T4VXS2_9HYPH|nr:ubiquinone-binding protein [Candidatus Liberibacter europaeus]PTL86574.1 MAG: ubiquinone-binding protein [Candidatus Liberibacter europaeus]